MSEFVNITINGKQIRAEKGKPILKVAEENNIYIPTLCYHEALEPRGSCRICIVEIIQKRGNRERTWVDAACVCPVDEGMIIETESPRVLKERKLLLELLLSRAPVSLALLELAKKYNAKPGRFEAIDKGAENCILCGLCVRVCDELIESHSLATAFRGVYKKVITPFQIAKDTCIGCGACAYVCPTGAIKVIEDGGVLKIENWDTELEVIRCKKCGRPIGPSVQLNVITKKYSTRVEEELFVLCPECRREILKEQIEKTSGNFT